MCKGTLGKMFVFNSLNVKQDIPHSLLLIPIGHSHTAQPIKRSLGLEGGASGPLGWTPLLAILTALLWKSAQLQAVRKLAFNDNLLHTE